MPREDAFGVLARHYDAIMEHAEYGRWYANSVMLAGLATGPIHHLDAACGTGTLLHRLAGVRWQSAGVDLSIAMLQRGRHHKPALALAAADLRALPFCGSFNFVTCLFDSLNFLLEEDALQDAFLGFARALRPGGVLYCDLVTERMVKDHFEGQTWTEYNGQFETRWRSTYDRHTGIAETSIRVNTGPVSIITERIYPINMVERMIERAGFDCFAIADSETWHRPGRRTTRVDYVAVKRPSREQSRRFRVIRAEIRDRLRSAV